ncbi:hypothetical protein BH11MYX3_BH11MYX3_16110 [soil metagenome]
MAVVTLALTIVMGVGWEILARQRGYVAGLDDTPDLWARARERLDSAPPDQVVLLGSSRMLFDLDIEEFHKAAGGPRPIQLATVGTNELFMLERLADSEFRGTAIVSFVPGLTFLPERAATRIVRKAVERYEKGSLAQRASAWLWQQLDARLACLDTSELTIRKLVEQVDLPQREGLEGAAMYLPSVHHIDEERRGYMNPMVETDEDFRDQIRANWVYPDPPSKDPPAQQAAEREGLRQQILWREYRAVSKIRARGGRVIYVRFPSSGGVLEQEDRDLPRAQTWDALLAVTGARGIHFQDHPELASFPCPEWSHLSATDSVEFTRRLMPLLVPHLAN